MTRGEEYYARLEKADIAEQGRIIAEIRNDKLLFNETIIVLETGESRTLFEFEDCSDVLWEVPV